MLGGEVVRTFRNGGGVLVEGELIVVGGSDDELVHALGEGGVDGGDPVADGGAAPVADRQRPEVIGLEGQGVGRGPFKALGQRHVDLDPVADPQPVDARELFE